MFDIINKDLVALKPSMYYCHLILKHLVCRLRDEVIACLIFNYIFLNKNNGVCYQKSLLDPGVQVWLDFAGRGGYMVDV